ncbi:MAG: GNAT family N-acetyltransferase [Acidimicrobiales bacterium]
MVVESSRAAKPSDVDQLVALAEQARDEVQEARGGALWSEREAAAAPLRPWLLDYIARAPGGDTIVVCGTIDEHVVGIVAAHEEVLRSDRHIARIDELYVEPGARGVGVGEAMMHTTLRWASGRDVAGIDAIVLPGNRDAKNFFERFGLTARAITVHRALDISVGSL